MAKLKNIELVNKMIAEGYIDVQKHPSADIYIYNYTRTCSIDAVWNEATLQCRGIIADKDYNIIAKPFDKFFNYEEIQDKSVIPGGAATAYEKMDGSLGIVYWIGEVPYICTRGSFTSDQALHATTLLRAKYRDKWVILAEFREKGYTPLFEIIYPENRIVVNYGDMDDIILIGILSNENPGDELDINDYSQHFTTAKCYGKFEDWLNIRQLIDGSNREGFVLVFKNGFRLKMKYEDYFRLHMFRTYLTKKHIFELVESGKRDELYEMANEFDEEVKMIVNKTVNDFDARFFEILNEARNEYRDFDTDKEAAEYFKTCKWTSLLFSLRKGKPFDKLIWKKIKSELKDE